MKIITLAPIQNGILHIENEKEILPNNAIFRDEITSFEAMVLSRQIRNNI